MAINLNHHNNSFSIGTSEAFRITSVGNVGMGTATPQASSNYKTFTISSGNGDGAQLAIFGHGKNHYIWTDTSGINFGAGYNGGGQLAFKTNGNNTRLYITQSGDVVVNTKVLIGTTTEGYSSGDDLTIATSGHTGITIRSGTTSEGAIYFSDATSGSAEYIGSLVYSHNTNAMVFTTNGTERLRIDSSGHMGLGITPSDIDSIGRALNIASSTGGAIYLQDTDSPTTKFGAISYNGATAALQIHAHHSNSYIDLGTNGTERLRITSGGNLLLGTTTNSQEGITVYGDAGGTAGGGKGSAIIFQNSNTGTGNNNGFYVGNFGNRDAYVWNYENGVSIFFGTSNSNQMELDSAGRLLLGTNTEGYSGADDLTINTSGDTGMTIRSGTSGQGTIAFSDATSGAAEYRGYVQYLHNGDALLFGTSSTERLRIDSSGRLMLGRTSASKLFNLRETSTSTGVHIVQTIGGANHVSAYAVGLGFDPEGYAARTKIAIVAEGTGAGYSRGKLHFLLDSANDSGEATISESRMTIHDNGDVGINVVSNGRSPLHIHQPASASTYLHMTNASTGSTNNDGFSIYVATDGQTYYRARESAGTHRFYTNGSERVRIASDGIDCSGNLYFDSDTDTHISNANTANMLRFTSASITVMDITNDHNVKLHDNRKLWIGASNDIQIYHASSNNTSYYYHPQNNVNQSFNVAASWTLETTAADKRIECPANGTETGVRLFHNGSQKLETKSFGIQIEATPRVDLVGNGNSVELKFIGNGSTHRGSVYADNGNTIGFLKAGTGSWAARWHNTGKQTAHGNIVPNTDTSQTLGDGSYQWSSTYTQNVIARSGYPLQFYANNTYAGRVTTYGEWRLGTGTSSDNNVSTDYVHGIGGTALDSVTSNLARLVMQERSGHWISFKNGSGTHYGSIYLSGSNVVYGGTSDYRLKENVSPITGAISTLKLLKPITYKWNAFSNYENTDTHRGFLAHEVQEVEPDAVSGTKDGMSLRGNCVDESGETTQVNVLESQKKEGETWTKTAEVIDIQQLDERKLVPILTAALQEAIAKIEVLETEVAALKSA